MKESIIKAIRDNSRFENYPPIVKEFLEMECREHPTLNEVLHQIETIKSLFKDESVFIRRTGDIITYSVGTHKYGKTEDELGIRYTKQEPIKYLIYGKRLVNYKEIFDNIIRRCISRRREGRDSMFKIKVLVEYLKGREKLDEVIHYHIIDRHIEKINGEDNEKISIIWFGSI